MIDNDKVEQLMRDGIARRLVCCHIVPAALSYVTPWQ